MFGRRKEWQNDLLEAMKRVDNNEINKILSEDEKRFQYVLSCLSECLKAQKAPAFNRLLKLLNTPERISNLQCKLAHLVLDNNQKPDTVKKIASCQVFNPIKNVYRRIDEFSSYSGPIVNVLIQADANLYAFMPVFERIENPHEHIYSILQDAQKYEREDILQYLELISDFGYQYSPEHPKRIAHSHVDYDLGYSLKEVFNFHGKSGERITKAIKLSSGQETFLRESFSVIDNKDAIQKAADELVKRGSELPTGSRYKRKQVSKPPQVEVG